jgi:hypothetical protein
MGRGNGCSRREQLRAQASRYAGHNYILMLVRVSYMCRPPRHIQTNQQPPPPPFSKYFVSQGNHALKIGLQQQHTMKVEAERLRAPLDTQ